MTLPRSEMPLRRSAVGSHRESMSTTMVNDDEAERREARRRTLLQEARPRESSALESIEENETIRKCLEMYNGNKLSRDNAWSLSLIDTLSNLLDRHHKTLSNFKMAGSSLEASSKVYGLRVDSIYLDAMRMSAGLSARTLTEKQLNAAADKDDSITENPAAESGDGNNDAEPAASAAPKPKKRARKNVSTVTKNKESLNARLDTAPLQDPVFGKLNSTVGSINASNRLMHNILPTESAELRLSTHYRFWNTEELPGDEGTDYTKIEPDLGRFDQKRSVVSAQWANKLGRYAQQLKLRPLHSGYIITDAPNPSNTTAPNMMNDDDMGVDNADDFYANPKELSMAFDINAECEPMPELDGPPGPALLEVDYNELEELTTEERTTLQRCRALRKQPVMIDDLRPVDGSTKLEYSYRPMDKISQFWAGPSHWKFKRSRGRTTFGPSNAQDSRVTGGVAGGTTAATNRIRRAAQQATKRRSEPLNFGKFTDNLFQTLDATTKTRKANYQKRWDARKLLLPTKYEFEPNYFYKYDFAPGIKVTRRFGVQDDEDMNQDTNSGGGGDIADDVELFDNDHFEPSQMNVSSMLNGSHTGGTFFGGEMEQGGNLNQANNTMRNVGNDTVLEIATDFEGAPTQVTKVIVPFAKRAKVIDMKNLKRSCNSLIQKQLLNTKDEEKIPKHPKSNQEHYAQGAASFNDVYEKLPNLLTPKMADSLSPSVALYAVLHLANDMRLRLIPQDDFENFTIRQVTD